MCLCSIDQMSMVQVKWADVGGLDAVKRGLQQVVAALTAASAASDAHRAAVPKGVLLFGAPGCSKTLLARALACESCMNFLSVKGSELYSKYVGESEKAVAKLFARARQAAPTVVFFDELDGLTTARTAGGSGAPNVHRCRPRVLCLHSARSAEAR